MVVSSPVLVSAPATSSTPLLDVLAAVVAGAAGVGGAGAGMVVVGSETGAPMSSSTTGAFANDCGAVLPIRPCPVRGGATCEWTSETTGMRWRMTRRVVVVFVRRPANGKRARTGAAWGSAGNGASRWIVGTRNVGKLIDGSESTGSGVGRPGAAACRKIATTGAV